MSLTSLFLLLNWLKKMEQGGSSKQQAINQRGRSCFKCTCWWCTTIWRWLCSMKLDVCIFSACSFFIDTCILICSDFFFVGCNVLGIYRCMFFEFFGVIHDQFQTVLVELFGNHLLFDSDI